MKALLSLTLLAALAAAALAQSPYIVSGALTADDPRFDIPVSPLGVNNPEVPNPVFAYDVYAFRVSVSGQYIGEVARDPDPQIDSRLLIYQDAFDPEAPLKNLVNAGGPALASTFTIVPTNPQISTGSRIATGLLADFNQNGLPLVAGKLYFAVVSTGLPTPGVGGIGGYTLGLGGGPGDVKAAPVPEPMTLAALGLGAAALLRRRRKG